MTQRRTTRRTALVGLGALGMVTTAGACSLLPGRGDGEESPAPEASGGASDSGGEPAQQSADPTEEPGASFDGWVTEEDLDLVELDTAAADAEFGTMKGQLEREDRFGTWWSPGFSEDSPVFTAEPLSIDPRAEEHFGGRDVVISSATGVLVQTILEILDSPLLLEADNSRSGEVAPALLEAFGIEGIDASVFDRLFAEIPVSGAYDPAKGIPEMYDFEPLDYPSDGPRMSLLEANTAVETVDLEGFTGPLLLASTRGALPVATPERELPLIRTATFGLGLAEGGQSVLMVYSVNATPCVHIADPAVLPVAQGTEVPEDWQEHTLGDLTVSLPSELGDPAVSEVGLTFTDGERNGSVIRYLLGVSTPYPLSATLHVARTEVPGAELAVVVVGMGIDSTLSVTVSLHRGHEQFSIQIHHLAEDEAPIVAHQLLAGLRLAS